MDYDFSIPYTVTNIVAIATAILAMRWPTAARVLLGAIFIGAAAVNAYMAIHNSQIYIGYGELTANKLYRAIIFGPFAEHTQRYVLMIAACQLFIGVFTGYKGRLMQTAMIGGIVFLVALAPLGVGSAFPSTLIMAIAFLILLRKRIDFNIYELIMQKVKYAR